jgi:hypothetical protein
MPQYAHFDSSRPAPQPVLGWYDTDALTYPNPPPPEDMMALTPEQWDARTERMWAVQGGALVPYTPPPPVLTPADEATAMMSQPVIVQCVTVPALSATYPNNESVRHSMTGVVAQINAGLGLPGGDVTFNWPDVDGAERAWPAAEFVALTNAVANFTYACQQVVGGFSTTLPSNTLVIDSGVVLAARRLSR